MNNFYNLTSTELSSAVIVLNIIFSFVLQMAIVLIYKKTHQGLSYSRSFIFTLVMIGVLGTVVMMVVKSNLVGAFTLLGAFSLIRFRTILKETRDIAFVFFALVIGIAVGTDYYSIAIIATILLSLIILFLDHYGVGSMAGNLGLILMINAKNDLDMANVRSVLSQRADDFDLMQSRADDLGASHYVFSVKLKDNFDAAGLLKELGHLSGIAEVEIIMGDQGVEY